MKKNVLLLLLLYCLEFLSVIDGGRKVQYLYSKIILIEGYLVFNKVGVRGEMGNEKNRLI